MRRSECPGKALVVGLLATFFAASVGAVAFPVAGTAFLPELAIPRPADFVTAVPTGIAISGTQIRIALSAELSQLGSYDWGYIASSDGGNTFQASRAPIHGAFPVPPNVRVAALADGSFAYVWTGGMGQLMISRESTAGWSGPFESLTFVGDDFAAEGYGSDLLIAWVDVFAANGSLRLGSFVGGRFDLASWQVVDDHSTALKLEPTMVVDGQEVYLAWRRSTATESATFFAQGTFLGTLSPLSVSRDLTSPAEFHPSLAVSPSGTALVAYEDGSGSGWPVSAAIIESPYSQFGPVFNFGAAIGGLLPSSPSVRSDASGTLHVVWLDGDPVTQAGGFRVMYNASGVGWPSSATAVRLDGDPTQLSKSPPVLGLGLNGAVVVAWGDVRDGTGRSTPYVVRALGVPQGLFEGSLGRLLLGGSLTGGGAAIGGGGYALASWLRGRRREPGEPRAATKP